MLLATETFSLLLHPHKLTEKNSWMTKTILKEKVLFKVYLESNSHRCCCVSPKKFSFLEIIVVLQSKKLWNPWRQNKEKQTRGKSIKPYYEKVSDYPRLLANCQALSIYLSITQKNPTCKHIAPPNFSGTPERNSDSANFSFITFWRFWSARSEEDFPSALPHSLARNVLTRCSPHPKIKK